MAATGIPRRTVQRCCRWLEAKSALNPNGHDLLAMIEPGSTPRYPHCGYRRAALEAGATNLARTWVLIIPEGDELSAAADAGQDQGAAARSGAPWFPASPVKPSAGAGEPRTAVDTEGKWAGRGAPGPLPPTSLPVPWSPPWPLEQTPHRRRERLAACESLRGRHVLFARASARALRSKLRPWFDAGLTPAQILIRSESAPSGERHCYAGPVYDPVGLVEHRLALWDGPGAVAMAAAPTANVNLPAEVSPPAAEAAATRARVAAELARRAAELRQIPPAEHRAAQWRAVPRPGDPSRWEAIARAQVAEFRASRSRVVALAEADTGRWAPVADAPSPDVAGLAELARRGAADPAEAARRLRALAQVAAFRAGRRP